MLCFVLQDLLISGSKFSRLKAAKFRRASNFLKVAKILPPYLLMHALLRLLDLFIPATLFISSPLMSAQKLVHIYGY